MNVNRVSAWSCVKIKRAVVVDEPYDLPLELQSVRLPKKFPVYNKLHAFGDRLSTNGKQKPIWLFTMPIHAAIFSKISKSETLRLWTQKLRVKRIAIIAT